MIDTLLSERYRLGIYTTATRRAAMNMLVRTELDGRFATVVGGDEVSQPKPHPHGLQLTCRSLGVITTEAAYIGDAEVDLQCAQAAGAQGIHASWSTPTATMTGHSHVARHPHEVAGLIHQIGGRDHVR
jgi:phosphoglycolate phosphatase-like HAD superfamily hydrolase